MVDGTGAFAHLSFSGERRTAFAMRRSRRRPGRLQRHAIAAAAAALAVAAGPKVWVESQQRVSSCFIGCFHQPMGRGSGRIFRGGSGRRNSAPTTVENFTGSIGLHELRIMLQRLRTPVSECELTGLMASMNPKGDGRVTWPEFHRFVSRSPAAGEDPLLERLRLAARQAHLLGSSPTYLAAKVALAGSVDARAPAALPAKLNISISGDQHGPVDVASEFSGSEVQEAADAKERKELEAAMLRESFDKMSQLAEKAQVAAVRSDYHAKDWLRVLCTWNHSFILRRIFSPLTKISLWALFVAIVHCVFLKRFGISLFQNDAAGGLLKVMSLSGSMLSLLLVFRTNTAYQRYWEGRKIWERLCMVSRNAADFVALHVEELGLPRVRRIADLLCSFPLALQLHLQARSFNEDPDADLRVIFQRLRRYARNRAQPSRKRIMSRWWEKYASAATEMVPLGGREVPVAAFLEAARNNADIAAAFCFPSDIDEAEALDRLHVLKFGYPREKRRAVTFEELSAYYNPLELERMLSASVHDGTRAALRTTRCAPMVITRALGREVKAVPYDAAGAWTNRERLRLISDFNRLSGCISAAERIVQTPVPLHYARHGCRFLSIWCLMMPFTLVEQLGFFVVPVTAFVVWALFGLREIGLLVENPFRRPLQLQVVSDTISADVREIVDSLSYDTELVELIEARAGRA